MIIGCKLATTEYGAETFFQSQLVYFIGFQTDVAKFFIFFFTLFLTSLGASSIAFFFSGLVNATSIAILLIAMSFIIQMVSPTLERVRCTIHYLGQFFFNKL